MAMAAAVAVAVAVAAVIATSVILYVTVAIVLDEAEATDAADDDVLLSVIRDIDRGSLGRGLPALPAAPPPPPPLSASPKIDPPEVPPKSSGVRKQASSGALHARHHSNLGKNKQVWRDYRSAAARPATLS